MNKLVILTLVLFTVLNFSCRPEVLGPDPNPWEEVPNLSLNSTINSLYNAGFEMLIGTVDHFARLNGNNTLIERRELEVQKGVFGKPVLSPFVFTRVVKNVENDRELQFHLVKSINQIFRITDKELADSTEFLLFEELPNAFATGAFNVDGSQFLYGARSLNSQESHYSFFLFDIKLNAEKTQFIDVEMTHRIDIPESLLGPEASQLTNIRYFDGYYYVTTLNGAFRIESDGTWTQFFSHWTWDTFEFQDTLYTTGFYSNQFFKSGDGGQNWEYAETDTQLKKVEVKGNKVFGQDQLGLPYRLADENLAMLQEIAYNENFLDDAPTAYQAIEFYNGKFFVSVHKRLYFLDEIILKE